MDYSIRNHGFDDDLGPRVEEFPSSKANVVAGLILAAGILAGGITSIWVSLRGAAEANWILPFSIDRGWCWIAVIGMCGLGVVFVALGVTLAVICVRLYSGGVEICQFGFREISSGGTKCIRWTEVRCIVEITDLERYPIFHFPLILLIPKKASYRYQIHTESGETFSFNGTTTAKLKKFSHVLAEQAKQHGIEWRTATEDCL